MSALDTPEFKRPASGFIGFLMRFMPPKPTSQATLTVDRSLVRRSHYLKGFCAVVLTVGPILPLLFWSFDYLSVLGLLANAMHAAVPALSKDRALDVLLVLLVLWLARGRARGLWSKMARDMAWEEQIFREGAEGWGLWGRIRSCAIFSVAHIFQLIFSVLIALPIMVSGAYYMHVYLRQLRRTGDRADAVIEAALVHYAYNRVLIIFTPIVLVAVIPFVLLAR